MGDPFHGSKFLNTGNSLTVISGTILILHVRDALFRHGRLYRHATTAAARKRKPETECLMCQSHGIECDGNTPCSSCAESQSQCIKPKQDQQGRTTSETEAIQSRVDVDEKSLMSDDDDAQTHDTVSIISDRVAGSDESHKTFSNISLISRNQHDASSIEQRTARIWHFGNLEALNLYQTARPHNKRMLIPSDAEHTVAEHWDEPSSTHRAVFANEANEFDMLPQLEQNEASHGVANMVDSGLNEINCNVVPQAMKGVDADATSILASVQFVNPDSVQSLGTQASECLSPRHINSSINTKMNVDEFTTLAEHLDTIKCILTNTNIDLYFKHWHARWPLLHAPSQVTEDAPLGLQCSMALLGSTLKDDGHVSDEAKQLHECLWNDLMQKIPLVSTSEYSISAASVH